MTKPAPSATTLQHLNNIKKAIKKDIHPAAACGTLYGLGIGPGDPELITVKALKQLQAAPVVAFPAGLNGRPGVAERTIEPWLSAKQTKLPLHFPYVQNEKELAIAWETVEELQTAKAHKRLAFKSAFERYCVDNPDAPESRIYDC